MLRDVAGFINNYGSLMEIYGGSERGEAYAYNQAVQGGIYESSR